MGDDLFCTNVRLIEKGIEKGVANGVLIKLNQIGTLTAAMAAVTKARRHDWGAFVSHRSGETVDSFIADMTVALDLRWSWSHTADRLWEQIDPELWDRTHNPWLILQAVGSGVSHGCFPL
jgi:hypothetical protein